MSVLRGSKFQTADRESSYRQLVEPAFVNRNQRSVDDATLHPGAANQTAIRSALSEKRARPNRSVNSSDLSVRPFVS